MICTSKVKEIGTLPNHTKAILINFLPGTLSLTKKKFTDQIHTQLSTILLEKVLYTEKTSSMELAGI